MDSLLAVRYCVHNSRVDCTGPVWPFADRCDRASDDSAICGGERERRLRHLVELMDELYAVGSRATGRPRKWVWLVFPSLGLAVRVARGYAASDGRGGSWVYGMRVAGVGDGTVEAVLGHRLAEGLETPRQE